MKKEEDYKVYKDNSLVNAKGKYQYSVLVQKVGQIGLVI